MLDLRDKTLLIAAAVIGVNAMALTALAVWMLLSPGAFSVGSAAAFAAASTRIWDAEPEPIVPIPPIAMENAPGEKTGEGDSIASVDLDNPQVSPQVYPFEQAWTRQQPSFVPPSQSGRVTPQTPQPSAEQEQADRATQQPFGPPSMSGLLSIARPAHAQQETPTQSDVPADEKTIAAEQVASARQSPTPADQSASPAEPSAPDRPPNPAEAGRSDLDPFAMEEGITFGRGGVKARTGREVEMVRPRVDLKFMADATRMSGRQLSIKLLIETDDRGSPRRVTVLRSSGSVEIDAAVKLAIYDSWFGGKMPDAFPFTITLWD